MGVLLVDLPTYASSRQFIDFNTSKIPSLLEQFITISNRNKKMMLRTLQVFLWFLWALGKYSKFE